jgi:NAD(P)-dependent dehydrogenase (short-subunit alcohol dehydrogenase family)
MTSANPVETVLITGASSGIGRATAQRFARRGARLVLVARSAAGLRDAEAECLEAGARDVLCCPADIGERAEVQAAFAAAVDRFGTLDAVIQNAGIAVFGRFADVPADVFDTIIRTDVIGAANVARAALEHFTPVGRGHLVIVGSLLGHTAVPYMGPYVMSKFAITALIRMLRQEVKDTKGVNDIHVHGIYPGAVDTPIYPLSANYFGRRAHVLPFNDAADKQARAIVAAIDSGRPSERQVGILNVPMLIGYRLLPRVFDTIVGPLIRMAAFARDVQPPTPGNAMRTDEAVADHQTPTR